MYVFSPCLTHKPINPHLNNHGSIITVILMVLKPIENFYIIKFDSYNPKKSLYYFHLTNKEIQA